METDLSRGAPPRMPAPTQPGHPLVPEPVAPLMPHAPHRRHRYRLVLVIGLAVFAALTAAAGTSRSTIAVVAVLLVGSFFVPVVYVLYMDEIDMLRAVRGPREAGPKGARRLPHVERSARSVGLGAASRRRCARLVARNRRRQRGGAQTQDPRGAGPALAARAGGDAGTRVDCPGSRV